jgi:hypothetical protein
VSFLKKLFQGKPKDEGDPDGIYFHVQCDNCGEKLRIRADKRHDLVRDYETGALTWKKEIMDGRCFRLMYAEVVFDSRYRIQSQEIEGQGHFITQEEFLP